MAVTGPTVALPIDLAREGLGGRNARWVATLGRVTGYGDTQTQAKADLAGNLMAQLLAEPQRPAFATDSDGSVIVAVPAVYGTGSDVWRWPPGEAPRCNTSTSHAPAQALAGIHHYTLPGAERAAYEAERQRPPEAQR